VKVLAVEDDHEFREFLKMFFSTKHPDIELQVASSGEEALQTFGTFQPDVVVVDSYMPEMSGQELYGKIKEFAPSTPVISYSGSERGIAWADGSVDKGGRNNLDELVAAIRRKAS